MGLDMYLDKEVYIGAGNALQQNITTNIKGEPLVVDMNEVKKITLKFAFWRKVNQIHKWFVTNVQGDEDDCKPYEVDGKQLIELRNLCKKALKTKDSTLLPTMKGFHFGETKINNAYWQNLKDTVECLENIKEDETRITYIYYSSW